MRNWIVFISLFIHSSVYSQTTNPLDSNILSPHPIILDLHYRSQINNSSIYFEDQKKIHSSVKPFISNYTTRSTNLKPIGYFKEWKSTEDEMLAKHFFGIAPLADISIGADVHSNNTMTTNTGIGISMNYRKNKFFTTLRALPYYSAPTFLADSVQTDFDHDFGTNRALASHVFFRGDFRAVYQVNKFFTFMGGYGKNFFGEGYRSLLLSDNAGANPFFKIETSFAGIKYVNLYNMWKDNTIDPFNKSLDIKKFSAIHYLSWNITRDINLSIFETVVWQGKDTLTNRGFDFNYLNPIVFYRPVEYNLGSSDNVLLGANLSYKIDNKNNIYGQFVLDEFLLSELKNDSKWWANKYGFQLGYKSNNFFIQNLYFQLELNAVRPFTYSHKSSTHSYGHLNSPAAHPIGANFYEVLNIISYKQRKHRITNKIAFSAYGVDNDSTSYGQNIFISYTLREGNYNHLIMQGLRKNVFNETIIYEYEFWENFNMRLTAAYNWRMVNTSVHKKNIHSFTIGIKSRIWNSYKDF